MVIENCMRYWFTAYGHIRCVAMSVCLGVHRGKVGIMDQGQCYLQEQRAETSKIGISSFTILFQIFHCCLHQVETFFVTKNGVNI